MAVLEEQHLGFFEEQAEVSEPLGTDGAVDDPMIAAQRHAHDARRTIPDNGRHTHKHTHADDSIIMLASRQTTSG